MTSASRVESLWVRSAEIFIIGSALLNLLGWSLALTHQLKPLPYAIGLAITIGILVGLNVRQLTKVRTPNQELHRLKRRLRRPIFAIFCLIWLAALIGGLLYAPSNYDALSYRTPQLLHWLSENGWHWIVTPNSRMNISSPGFNWLTAPFIVLLRTDRISFIVNVLGFALLPQLIFEMLRRAGVAKPAAWWWMWLIPSAYVFATQAGGTGNDLTGTVYSVAAIAFALRARDTGRFIDASLSLLAVATCTGIKNTNLPIILPWAVALGSSGWRAFALAPAKGIVVAVLAAFASCAPTTVLNVRQTGHWTGDPHDEHRVRQRSLVGGLVSNAFVLTTSNLQPPLWLAPKSINAALANAFRHASVQRFISSSPRFDAKWGETPIEESAGLGPGLLALALASSIASLVSFRRREFRPAVVHHKRWDLALASGVALLVPVCSLSSEGLPRLLAPLLPSAFLLVLLANANIHLPRNKIWQTAGTFSACLSLPSLVLSPARPLFPWRSIINHASSGQDSLNRVERVYSTYSMRADAFEPLRTVMPHGTRNIELVSTGDEPETSLWRPFGSVKLRHVLNAEALSHNAFVVGSDSAFRIRFGLSTPEFASAHKFEIVGSSELLLRASGEFERWYVLSPTP